MNGTCAVGVGVISTGGSLSDAGPPFAEIVTGLAAALVCCLCIAAALLCRRRKRARALKAMEPHSESKYAVVNALQVPVVAVAAEPRVWVAPPPTITEATVAQLAVLPLGVLETPGPAPTEVLVYPTLSNSDLLPEMKVRGYYNPPILHTLCYYNPRLCVFLACPTHSITCY